MSKQQQQSSSSSRPKYDLFSIPMLSPLLFRSYDIPAPVIHPPGSDPSYLLNPNRVRHQVLETASSMDVDPCVVVTRREIVAKEFDLTASEHAGVALSEATTMVSATSNDATNSVVVAPQIENDMAITKTESKNTKSIVCDVCNVICDSENAFKKHIHLKKTQKSTVSSTINKETPSPVANVTSDQESEKKKLLASTGIKRDAPSSVANDSLHQEPEKKKQDLCQKETACGSLFVCDIPEPGIDYPKIAMVEMDESLFKNGVPNPKPLSRTTAQASNGSTRNRPVKLSVHQPMWCDICKVSCNNSKIFDQHIAGKQHQKSLKMSEKTLTTTFITSMDTKPVTKSMEKSKSTESKSGDSEDGKTIWCEVCKVSLPNNAYEYNKHVSGKKHRKNLQSLKKMQKLPSTVVDLVTAPPAIKLIPTKGEVVNPNEGNTTRCELCGVCCTSPNMLNRHILGKRHQKNMKKSGNQCVSSPARVAKTPSPEPMHEEGEIVLSKRSKRKVDDSLTSDDDADTKRQKMNAEGCGVLVTCRVCNVVCDGLMAFNTHLVSFEHSTMVLKHARGGSNGLQV